METTKARSSTPRSPGAPPHPPPSAPKCPRPETRAAPSPGPVQPNSLTRSIERVPTVLRRVQLVGVGRNYPGHGPHARRPRCVYPHRLQYLQVFDAVALPEPTPLRTGPCRNIGIRASSGPISMPKPSVEKGRLAPRGVWPEPDRGAGQQCSPFERPGRWVSASPTAALYPRPSGCAQQALGELADVAPDLLDCGLGDGHLGLAQLPRKLPAPENVACAGARRSGLPHHRS